MSVEARARARRRAETRATRARAPTSSRARLRADARTSRRRALACASGCFRAVQLASGLPCDPPTSSFTATGGGRGAEKSRPAGGKQQRARRRRTWRARTVGMDLETRANPLESVERADVSSFFAPCRSRASRCSLPPGGPRVRGVLHPWARRRGSAEPRGDPGDHPHGVRDPTRGLWPPVDDGPRRRRGRACQGWRPVGSGEKAAADADAGATAASARNEQTPSRSWPSSTSTAPWAPSPCSAVASAPLETSATLSHRHPRVQAQRRGVRPRHPLHRRLPPLLGDSDGIVRGGRHRARVATLPPLAVSDPEGRCAAVLLPSEGKSSPFSPRWRANPSATRRTRRTRTTPTTPTRPARRARRRDSRARHRRVRARILRRGSHRTPGSARRARRRVFARDRRAGRFLIRTSARPRGPRACRSSPTRAPSPPSVWTWTSARTVIWSRELAAAHVLSPVRRARSPAALWSSRKISSRTKSRIVARARARPLAGATRRPRAPDARGGRGGARRRAAAERHHRGKHRRAGPEPGEPPVRVVASGGNRERVGRLGGTRLGARRRPLGTTSVAHHQSRRADAPQSSRRDAVWRARAR